MGEKSKRLRDLSSLNPGHIPACDLQEAADYIDKLETVLAALLDDVEGGVDFGMPFDHPDNNFHESVMAARLVLGRTRKPA